MNDSIQAQAVKSALEKAGALTIPEERPVEEPRWFHEDDYEGMVNDIAGDLVISIYWREHDLAQRQLREAMNNPAAVLPDELKEQIMSEAVMQAALQANMLSSAAERASYALIWKVNNQRLFHNSREEYDSLEEWLTDKIPDINSKSELSDVMFIVNHLLPMVDKYSDISHGELLELKEKWTKTRATVPFLREQVSMVETAQRKQAETLQKHEREKKELIWKKMNEKDAEVRAEIEKQIVDKIEVIEKVTEETTELIQKASENFAENTVKAFELVNTPDVPHHGPTGIAARLREGQAKFEKFHGTRHDTDESVAFTVVVPVKYAKAVETNLRTLVEFHISDAAPMLKDLQELLLPKTNKED